MNVNHNSITEQTNKQTAKKLHIGCGKRYLEGYLHIDLLDLPHIDYKTSADNLDMFEDGSVEGIYACHILEHYGRHSSHVLLDEFARVLKKDGTVHIAVPDFDAIIAEYTENRDMDKIMGALYGGQDYEYNFHYQVFNFERLKSKLEQSGFYDVERYHWKDFLPEGADDYSRAYLPHMDFEHGRLMSLNVTAKKK